MKSFIKFAGCIVLAICWVSSVHGEISRDEDTDTDTTKPNSIEIPFLTFPHQKSDQQKDVIGEILTVLNQHKEFLNDWINVHGEHIRQTLFMMQYRRFDWAAYVNEYMRVAASWLDN